MVDIEVLKTQFLDTEFDRTEFQIKTADLVTVANASGETRPQFTDPDHADFQAAPAFLGSLSSGRHLPIDFPSMGGIPMDGGKAVTCLLPVRPEVPMTGKSHIHEIYDKQGRSGRMIFIVVRHEVFDQDDVHLASIDSRLVIREKSV
ncbi:MAG TPA: hypothetical protein DER02_08300 [Gammaproteobacteria bacterium]|nr:hypothetical protein [Gammaproteobacteria bacterium]|tara:strand:- start:1703 stop:2143 length:441 start_codon:yes stop_codon:yes gene_type:complete